MKWFARLEIQILLMATARAFRRRGRLILFRKPEEALAAYKDFTLACMVSGDADPGRIYRTAYALGSLVRKVFRVRDRETAQALVFYLYHNIGITMNGELPGEIIVSDCYFGHYYTPKQCALMSLMDWGIVAGICDGGKLTFYERITQRCGRCRACLTERRFDR